MNHKHLALIIVGLLAFLCIQGVLWVRGIRDESVKKARDLEAQEQSQRQILAVQAAQLNNMKTSSSDLIEFLNAWEIPLSSVTSSESAEALFITKVRDAEIATLAQRFDNVPLKLGDSLPQAVRAQLIFEDNYGRLLNWLGRIEEELPAVRISSVQISKGTRPEDIRMEAIIDQPIYKP